VLAVMCLLEDPDRDEGEPPARLDRARRIRGGDTVACPVA
jgi:hypothetical protein